MVILMNELVERLANGEHPVSTARYKTAAELKECIDRQFVLVKFTGTRGGTELGYKLDMSRSNIGDADFGNGSGRVMLAGELTLNYVKVRCVAEIDLATLVGSGHLEILEEQSSAA